MENTSRRNKTFQWWFANKLVMGAHWWGGKEYNFLITRLSWHGKSKTIEIEQVIQKKHKTTEYLLVSTFYESLVE